MQVRVENLYYLLSYAWDFPLQGAALVRPSDASCTEALLARMLRVETERLLRGRIDRGYVEHEAELRRPRGKLSVQSLAHGSTLRGVIGCRFDDLSADVLHNQVLRSTLVSLARLATLRQDEAGGLRRLADQLPEVGVRPIQRSDFRKLQLGSNLRRYRPAMLLCELLHRCIVPEPSTAGVRFRAFTGDEREMGLLFEGFVRGFLRREQSIFPKVEAVHVPWIVEGESNGLLPRMKTDITLRRPGERVVIETKCYAKPRPNAYGGSSAALRSSDLYQLGAYTTHLASTGDRIRGVLLYAVDQPTIPPTRMRLAGAEVLIDELNLAAPWSEIDGALRALVGKFAAEAAAAQPSAAAAGP